MSSSCILCDPNALKSGKCVFTRASLSKLMSGKFTVVALPDEGWTSWVLLKFDGIIDLECADKASADGVGMIFDTSKMARVDSGCNVEYSVEGASHASVDHLFAVGGVLTILDNGLEIRGI